METRRACENACKKRKFNIKICKCKTVKWGGPVCLPGDDRVKNKKSDTENKLLCDPGNGIHHGHRSGCP
jgi:hypothetical protein